MHRCNLAVIIRASHTNIVFIGVVQLFLLSVLNITKNYIYFYFFQPTLFDGSPVTPLIVILGH